MVGAGGEKMNYECPKCGEKTNIMTKHHEDSSGCYKSWLLRRQFQGEHLHHKCNRCDYEWWSSPLDKGTNP